MNPGQPTRRLPLLHQALCVCVAALWLPTPAKAQLGGMPINYTSVNHQIGVLAAQVRGSGMVQAEYERRLAIVALRVVAVLPQLSGQSLEAQALQEAARSLAPDRLSRADLQPAWDRTRAAHAAFAALTHPQRVARDSADWQ